MWLKKILSPTGHILPIVLVGVAGVGLWLIFRPPGPETIAAPEEITAKFKDTVFGHDFDVPDTHLSRWGGRYHLVVQGRVPAYLRNPLPRHLAILRRLTGLDIRLTEPGEPGNVELHHVADDVFRSLSMRYRVSRTPGKWVDQAACFVTRKNRRFQFVEGLIAIRDRLPPEASRSCLLEELYQGLGPGKNSEALPPSISETRQDVTELSINDKIILRALYDPRLKPGMEKDEAMKIVPGIVEELVAAVKARGRDALIHPDYRP